MEKYAHEKLFKPLEITNYQWQYTPQKVVNTAGGLQLSALDYAKYGQLYQNKGRWNGKQIVPSEWVTKSHSNYFADMQNETPYGYLTWEQKL